VVRSRVAEFGVARLPELLSPSLVVEAREWLNRVESQAAMIPPSFEPEFEAVGARQVVRKLRRLFWNDTSFWERLLSHARIPQLAARLVGAPAALTFHAAFLKAANIGTPVALHQDQALWMHPYPSAITIWIALTPVTPSKRMRRGLRG